MKNKLYVLAVGMLLVGLAFPSYAQASDGEEYITISVDAVDDNANLQYALDSDAPSAFTESNEFRVPAGTSHTIYVKDVAGNITSRRFEPDAADGESDEADSYYDVSDSYEDDEQRINIDLELGKKDTEEEAEPEETGNPGTASVSSRTKTDGTVDGEKVFYTFSTKEGEELYLVVDQGRGTDNVYLLDTVSLSDLRVLADGNDTSNRTDDKGEDNLLSILAEENETAGTPEEPQANEKPKSTFGNALVILLFAGIGGGIYYLDTIIFFCENKLHKVKAVVSDSKEAEPDVELMIRAETAHLKTENECLKKREMPAHLLEEEGEYFCPKCQYKQPDPHVRYCANCGHRVIFDRISQ